MKNFISGEQEIINTIKDNITRLRKANGLTMRETAAALSVKENTYRVWEEKGKSAPRPVQILQIAKAYGVSTDFIYSNTNDDIENNKHLAINSNESESDEYIYGDKYLSELSSAEKILIMQIRCMNASDRQKAIDAIKNIVEKIN